MRCWLDTRARVHNGVDRGVPGPIGASTAEGRYGPDQSGRLHLLAAAHRGGRDLSSMSGVLAGRSYRLLST